MHEIYSRLISQTLSCTQFTLQYKRKCNEQYVGTKRPVNARAHEVISPGSAAAGGHCTAGTGGSGSASRFRRVLSAARCTSGRQPDAVHSTPTRAECPQRIRLEWEFVLRISYLTETAANDWQLEPALKCDTLVD